MFDVKYLTYNVDLDGFKTDMAISGGNRLNGQKREMETKELKVIFYFIRN